MTAQAGTKLQAADSVLQIIGSTPLVYLDRITGDLGRIAAKCEFLNPGFSKKDRFALQIISDAEKCGKLKPGQTVVELTSGNAGTGLAIVCGAKGYPFVAVMSRGNSIERARMMRALGAEVVLVDQLAGSVPGQVSGGDLEEVERVTRQLVQERNAFRADQFENLSNCMSHHDQTAAEIWEQTNGMVTAFCDFVGTGGSWAGCTKYFREQNAAIRCHLIEPEGAAALKGECVTKPGHRIQGGGYARQTLTQIAGVAPDGFLTVSDDEAIATTRLLARKEGLFCGFSSGANVAAALQLLRGPCRGGIVAVLLCDSGLKYISTDLWD